MSAQPIVSLTVVSGPDLGRRHVFHKERISIGRDANNDFVLSDGFVSNHHGRLQKEGNNVLYYDLRSRHGTRVLIDEITVNLHDHESVRHVRVTHECEIQVGSTLIKVELQDPAQVESAFRQAKRKLTESQERYITAAHRPVEDWTRGLSRNGHRDKSLDLLFFLAGRLNSLTQLEDILDLIVETTFEAFPAANFFAISLIPEGKDPDALHTYMTRSRGVGSAEGDAPILSQSILRRVVDTRESILFVRDHLGDVSQSILEAQITACLCAPLVGQKSLLGVMQVDTRGKGSLFSRQDLDLFSVLASNAAFALERARLTQNIYDMFEAFVDASVTAIERRDPTTAGHSQRVADYTMQLARAANESNRGPTADIAFSNAEMTELRYTALLHDFGKIAVDEAILKKSSRLSPAEMAVISQRFATFKGTFWRILGENLLKELAREGRAPSPEDLETIQKKHKKFCQELDDGIRLIIRTSKAQRVSDQELELVLELGRRTVQSASGARLPLLTEREITNLSIQRSNLNEEEWEKMRSHVAESETYLHRIPWSEELSRIPDFAGAHHEKLDGSGYPRQISAENIPDQVRILTIADIFDAITAADRPYRNAADVPRALKILKKEAKNGQLDERFVDLFIETVVPQLSDS